MSDIGWRPPEELGRCGWGCLDKATKERGKRKARHTPAIPSLLPLFGFSPQDGRLDLLSGLEVVLTHTVIVLSHGHRADTATHFPGSKYLSQESQMFLSPVAKKRTSPRRRAAALRQGCSFWHSLFPHCITRRQSLHPPPGASSGGSFIAFLKSFAPLLSVATQVLCAVPLRPDNDFAPPKCRWVRR